MGFCEGAFYHCFCLESEKGFCEGDFFIDAYHFQMRTNLVQCPYCECQSRPADVAAFSPNAMKWVYVQA